MGNIRRLDMGFITKTVRIPDPVNKEFTKIAKSRRMKESDLLREVILKYIGDFNNAPATKAE
jgi:hypothetical protein